MSIQPSPISSTDAKSSHWHDLIKLADILSIQFSLESQLAYILNLLERNYSIKARIWLAPSFSSLIINEGLQNNASLLSGLSPCMEQSYLEKRILPKFPSNPNELIYTSKLAVPLLIKDEVLGVIQLEKPFQVGYTAPEVEPILCLISQFSLVLSHLQQETHSDYLQQNITQLTLIEEVSKSILSNLDRDSLLNNILSLLHLEFNYQQVNIFTSWGDNKKVLKQIGISEDGIEPEKIYDYDLDEGPVHWSITHLEPVIINNTSLDFRFPAAEFPGNIQSELVIPLLYGELFTGVLDLCSDFVDVFGPGTLKGFQILAQNIAIAIRNSNLYHSEQVGKLINALFQKTVGKISAEETLDDLLENILYVLEEILPWDAAAIWLIDNTANEAGISQFTSVLRLAAARVKGQSSIETEQVHPSVTNEMFEKYIQNAADGRDLLSAYTWISDIINSEISVIRNSTSAYEPLGALLGFKSEYSAFGIPLFNDDKHSGIIILVHHQSQIYDFEAQSIASTFAKYASLAIENTKLYVAAHDQAWISTVLLQVAEATQSITNTDELLDTIVSMLPDLIGVDACTIFLFDQSIETFYPQASNGIDAKQLERFNSWDIHPGSVPAFDLLKESNSPVILNTGTLADETVSEIFPNNDFHNDLVILFPLFTKSSLYGAILIDFTNSTLGIDSSQEVWDEKYTLIQGAARQTATAIENLQLIKSQEEEAYISVALLQVAQAIVSLNQLDEILGTIVRITPILVGLKRCIIYLWDNKDRVFRQSEFYGFSKIDLNILGQVFKSKEFPFIDAIQQSNQIIYHSIGVEKSPLAWNEIEPGDYQVVERIISDSEEEISIKLDSKSLTNRERLLIGFPLSVKGEMLGVMLIEEDDPIKGSPSVHIREKRIEIIKGITQQAAIAIKNELLLRDAVKSERMERELQLAREIQTTFLPDKLPEIPGWDIAFRWQPARQVGGDFYDIFFLDDERIGFVIADVADKGMPAALFMTLIRTLIRAASKEKYSPAAVLRQVNELLVPDSKHGMFVTVFYGVFSLKSGKVVYANAGHNPPVIKQIKRDELIELKRTTIALGIFSEIEVDEREISLHPGDWMFLYTDGVTEAFSIKEEMFGTDRLYRLLLNNKFTSSSELIDTIESEVEDFIIGTDLSDDITLAAITRMIL
jgi:sigma-B regulation protein RsbU (phosphoserine phosphatase)